MRFRREIALFMATGLLISIVSLETPAKAAVTKCADVLVLGARGSGDNGPGTMPIDKSKVVLSKTEIAAQEAQREADPHGLGGVVNAVWNQLNYQLLVQQHRSVQVQSVEYPAIGADLFKNLIPDILIPPHDFFTGINAGVQTATLALQLAAVHCPNQWIVLVGYSQGAMVMHRVLQRLSTEAGNNIFPRIVDTILVADGDKKAKDNVVQMGSASSNSLGVAVKFPAFSSVSKQKFVPSLKNHIISVCTKSDLVCDNRMVVPLTTAPGLLLQSPEILYAKTVHTNYNKTGRQLLLEAADYVASDLAKLPKDAIQCVVPLGAANDCMKKPAVEPSDQPTPITTTSDGPDSGTTGSGNKFPVKWRQISVGWDHTCGVTNSGAAYCWGSNYQGQLGNGNRLGSLVPIPVPGLETGVSWISAGVTATCAVTSAGSAYCWGANTYGQLGTGNTNPSLIPIKVPDLPRDATSISTDGNTTCVVTTSGELCWGANTYGQLGTGNTNPSLIPFLVGGLPTSVSAISVHSATSCAATSEKTFCWGQNEWGQLGSGNTKASSIPIVVSGLPPHIISISTSKGLTCARTTSGAAYCWGLATPRPGGESEARALSPIALTGLSSGVASISVGLYYACAITFIGSAYCWGNNVYGQLGSGDTTNSLKPVAVLGLPNNVASISAGDDGACALSSLGDAYCWGMGQYGTLGNGRTTNSLVAVQITSP